MKRCFWPSAFPVDEICVTVVPEPGVHARWIMEQTAIELLSPVLIAVPEAVTEAEVLAEGAMHLLSAEAVQVATDIGYGDDAYTPVYLNQGVQLWLSWERDDPLAKYRKVIVPWVYGELPLGPSQLPASFFEMCQLIDIWQRPRWELGVYLPCALTTPVISPDPPPATLLDDIPILGPSHMSAWPQGRPLGTIPGRRHRVSVRGTGFWPCSNPVTSDSHWRRGHLGRNRSRPVWHV